MSEKIKCSRCGIKRNSTQFAVKKDGSLYKTCLICNPKEVIKQPNIPNNSIIENLLNNSQIINDKLLTSLILKYYQPSTNDHTNQVTKIDMIRQKYKNAPPLKKLNEDINIFFQNENPANLLQIYKNGDLHNYISKMIIDEYTMSKDNKENQSIYVADVARKKFIIRCTEKNYAVWKDDPGGVILKSLIVDPIIKQFEIFMTCYMLEVINKKQMIKKVNTSYNEYIKHRDHIEILVESFSMKIFKLEEDFNIVTTLLNTNCLNDLSNKTLTHLANGFGIE